jgi:hypothetical protein
MNEERMKILQMLQDGKISVDEAAKLIASVENATASEQSARRSSPTPEQPIRTENAPSVAAETEEGDV